MTKPKQIIPIHNPPPIEWKILPGRRRMNITPYVSVEIDILNLKMLIKNGSK